MSKTLIDGACAERGCACYSPQFGDTDFTEVINMTEIEKIMIRLDQLYREIPLESCGYVLSAIKDIESIVYPMPEWVEDKEYEIGDLKDAEEFAVKRHYTNTNNPIDFP